MYELLAVQRWINFSAFLSNKTKFSYYQKALKILNKKCKFPDIFALIP